MITSRLFKVVALSVAVLFIQACSHPIEIVGQGDVTSASGNRNCYLEDFQTAKVNCTKNYAVGAYQETYYAVPRPGWKFDKWGNNYCPNATPPNYDCSFNIGTGTVQQYWGQTMPPLKAVFISCTPGAPGCGWKVGDLVTYNQVLWGTTGTTAASLMNSKFGVIYFSSGGVLVVGITGVRSIRFTSGPAVVTYLPSAGPSQALTSGTSNPTTTSSGILGGEVTALAVNVDFSAGGLLGGTVTTDFGDLSICGVSGLSNMSVSSFLTLAENALGAAITSYTPAQITAYTQQLNAAFLEGTPSTFAQDHLVNGLCP